MKVVLINCPCSLIDDSALEPPLGLLYVQSALEQNGIDTQLYDMVMCKNEIEFKNRIQNIPEAKVYCFTTYCTNYNNIKECIKYIRNKYSKSYIILGGPNATALPEYTLKDSCCDFIITGEGEWVSVYLISGLEEDILPVSPIMEGWTSNNLDDYPMPLWERINFNDYTRVLDGERVISIISSRGCPNACTHCNSIVMGAGRKIRYRSTENIVKEIKYLQSLGFNHFRFSDDNFACRPDLRELTLELKKLNIKYRIFAHIKEMTDENCKLLSESGCLSVAIGLESMNPDNLRFLRKNTNVNIVEENLRNVKRYNMSSRVYFIVGLPYDNNETIEKYMTIVSLLPFDEYNLYPLISYPGTAIWNTPEKFGYTIIDKDFTKYIQTGRERSTCFVLNHKNFSYEDVKRWVKYSMELLDKRGKIHNSQSKVAK